MITFSTFYHAILQSLAETTAKTGSVQMSEGNYGKGKDKELVILSHLILHVL